MITSVLTSTPVVVSDVPLLIDPAEVLRFQGYKQGTDVPTPEVAEICDQALAEGERLMEPRVVYRAIRVSDRKSVV